MMVDETTGDEKAGYNTQSTPEQEEASRRLTRWRFGPIIWFFLDSPLQLIGAAGPPCLLVCLLVVESPILDNMVTMKSKSTETAMIIQTGQKWYDIYPIEISTVGRRLPRDKEISLRKEAETLLNQECQLYLKSLQSGSKKAEFSWMLSVTKTGTFADKLSAHTLLLQDSAIHNLESLRTLTGMVQANAKREYLMSLAQLKEVYLADLLPPRKLRNFCDLVFELPEDEEERNIKLMVSYFEDQLKHYYKQFIDAIGKMSHDAIPLTKSKSISAFYELLKSNPEQEQYLLENLVNKLGDPVAKSASLALYLLKKLMVEDHPAMKEVIVKEVERVMFRPNVKERAQFYCLCFLQEVVFTLGDTDLANRLIDIYFGFFKKCTNDGDVNNKTMKGILSGVSRALPFSSLGQNVVRQHMEVFFRMIHLVNISIAIQILCLLFQVVSLETHHLKKKSLKSSRKKKGKDSDLSITSTMTQTISPGKDDEMKEAKNLQERYYSALYRFLLRKDVFESTSRLAMLFNLLYRSMKYDEVDTRVLAFVKRLLQVMNGYIIFYGEDASFLQ